MLWQRVPLLYVHQVVALPRAFPPAWIVIVFCDFHEAQLFVIVRTDPLRGIERTLLERRIDVARRDLLRHTADPSDDGAGKSADAEFQAFEILGRLDLLAEPAAHLRTGAAGRNAVAVVFLEQVVEHVLAAAEIQPCDMLAGVEAERQRSAEGKRRVLAPVIIKRGIAYLDGAVRNGVEHLQPGHQFAGGKRLNLEAVVGYFGDALAKIFATPVKRIERFRPAGRVSPLELRHRLRNRRRGNRAGGETDAACFQKITTFHALPPPLWVVPRRGKRSSVSFADRRR